MDRHREEAAAKSIVVVVTVLVLGVIPLILFALYWFCCRRRGIPGVVLGVPNAVQPNTVVVPGQYVEGPTYPTGAAATPFSASNPNPATVSAASGAGAAYPSMMYSGAPPSYNQSHHEGAEQVPLYK